MSTTEGVGMGKYNVRPDIDAAAEKAGPALGSKREIENLPSVLWEGETVDMLVTGLYGGGNGLVALTDRRLIFFKHGMMSQKLEDFPLGNISSVEWTGGMLMGTLTVYASGNRADIKNVAKAQGAALSGELRMRLSKTPAAAAPAASVPSAAQDVASRLATLDQLRLVGAITDAEYQDRRTAILNSI
ncbi:PH domain-containing protein [Streptomyces zaomyceticus]|uniref:PH domain-containing protein n=1 Tax=Streptomyces zaomyceticus TaxID=68286 RepID=UPI001E626FB6|nr:PH domain-containing protein [Streptomyces zaomyceticus]